MHEHGLRVSSYSFDVDVEIWHRSEYAREVVLDGLQAFQPPDDRPCLSDIFGFKHSK
jgi:hypothetical protein